MAAQSTGEKNLPDHIALVVDGNRRWAREQKLPTWRGHQKGAETVKMMARAGFNAGVHHMTFWVLSEDNLKKRSDEEIGFLMQLFTQFCEDLLKDPEIVEKEVRIRFVGRWKALLPKEVIEAAERLQEKTKEFSQYTLTVLLAYDGCQEMLAAIQSLVANGGSNAVTPEALLSKLWTGYLPPVDLVIRTGGEPHWSSGFMMWQTANSEFYFTNTYAPAFDEKEFQSALAEYETRRRMGGA